MKNTKRLEKSPFRKKPPKNYEKKHEVPEEYKISAIEKKCIEDYIYLMIKRIL